MKKIGFIFIFVLLLPVICQCQEYSINNEELMRKKEVNIGERKILTIFMNKKEAKELILLQKGKKDLQLSKKYNCNAFILDDGRLLLSHEGGGTLYNSPRDLTDLMNFANKTSKPHPLIDGIPYGVNYLNCIDTIINEFAQKLKIDLINLDKSVESLKIIEQNLKKLNLDEFELEKEYLIYLITYSGEVIRKQVGGSWVLNELTFENKIVYEPVIKIKEYREYSPLWSVYQEIVESPKNFSLFTAIGAEIEKYKLMDAMLKKK